MDREPWPASGGRANAAARKSALPSATARNKRLRPATRTPTATQFDWPSDCFTAAPSNASHGEPACVSAWWTGGAWLSMAMLTKTQATVPSPAAFLACAYRGQEARAPCSRGWNNCLSISGRLHMIRRFPAIAKCCLPSKLQAAPPGNSL